MTEQSKEEIKGSYWITTCYMCKKEFKLSCTFMNSRRFCSFMCKKAYRKEKGFWED